MCDRETFEKCVEKVHWNWFSWYMTLNIPRVPGPKYSAFSRATHPDSAFKEWIAEVRYEYCRGPEAASIYFIRVKEKRERGEMLQHVLLSGVPKDMQGHWRYRWWQLTAGAAWDRRMGGEMQKLIRYFFYKRHFDVEFDAWVAEAYCKAGN